MHHRFTRRAALVLGAVFVAGCSTESVTAPAAVHNVPATQSSGLLGGLLSVVGQTLGSVVGVVTRVLPVRSGVTTSAVIDGRGGTLSLPSAGLTIVVPAGAVSSPTRISVTAVPGDLVAYTFEPHGIKFAKPLKATQSLGLLNLRSLLSSGSVSAGYFAQESDLNTESNTATISESLKVNVSLLGGTVTWDIWHFSGYLLSTGRQADTMDSDF
jgi:hypothetical protein